MNSRDAFLQQFRGDHFGDLNSDTLSDEWFQNSVLRPILKLQNQLIIECFKDYLSQHKINFKEATTEYKFIVIDNAIFKDIKFQNILKGFIIGLFTTEEYSFYLANNSKFNKRIRNMLIERLKSQMQLFDTPSY